MDKNDKSSLNAEFFKESTDNDSGKVEKMHNSYDLLANESPLFGKNYSSEIESDFI